MAVLGAVLCVIPAMAQLPPEAQLAGETWLLKDCSVGEQDQLGPVLRKFKAQFELFFLNAANNGPAPQRLMEVEAAASKRFQLIQDTLKSGKRGGLSEADLQRVRAITLAQYVALERENFVLSYKSRAVGGLGVVAAERGRAVLRALASDPNSRLQGSAQQALLQLQASSGTAGKK